MRLLRLFLFLLLAGFAAPAMAAEVDEFYGSPAILPSGIIMLQGRDVTLWGIDMLANDQQCWHEDLAWDCGEQALIALRHHMANYIVHCVVKSDLGDGKVVAQCFRKKNDKEQDLSRYLVEQGWARDNKDVSGGVYTYEEEQARKHRHGIWTSRFQTVEDWKSGTQRFVQYEEAAPPAPTTTQSQTVNSMVAPAGSVLLVRPGTPHEHEHDHDHPLNSHSEQNNPVDQKPATVYPLVTQPGQLIQQPPSPVQQPPSPVQAPAPILKKPSTDQTNQNY